MGGHWHCARAWCVGVPRLGGKCTGSGSAPPAGAWHVGGRRYPCSAGRGAAVGPAPGDGDRRGMESRWPRWASARGIQPFLCRCFCPLCPLSDTSMALLEELGSKGDEGVLLRQDCVFAGQTPVSLEGAPGTSFHPTGSVVSVTALKGNCHMSLWKVYWKSQWCWRPP